MKIAIVGTGYVGLSNAVILAQHHEVVALDIDPVRVDQVNDRVSPIEDTELEDYLQNRPLDLKATLDHDLAYAGADFVVVATPTDYDTRTHFFDTSTVEKVISQVLETDRDTPVVIKSTVPVGFTERMRREHPGATIIFSPEFLREGRALYDNLHPSRIVVGASARSGAAVALGKRFADLLAEGALDDDVRSSSPSRPRPRRSSCSPTPTSRCASPTSTSSTRTPRRTASTRGRSSRASAWTRGSGRTTTTRRSGTAATACRRTPGSSRRTTARCRRT